MFAFIETVETPDYANESNFHLEMRNAYFRQAALAQSAGDSVLAQRFSSLGHFHNGQLRNATFELTKLKMLSENERTSLDLHGLLVKDALATCEDVLSHAKQNSIKSVCIITGVGKHSHNNTPKLLPAVKGWLDSHRYNYEQPRGGEFVVTL